MASQGRVWEGRTESGVPVQCVITRIAAPRSEDLQQFERELFERHAPAPAEPAFPMRMIL